MEVNDEGYYMFKNISTGFYLNTEVHQYPGLDKYVYLYRAPAGWWSAQWDILYDQPNPY
jgi:hypothetical protein